MIVPESGIAKRTHLTPLYHPDTLINPDTYIVNKLLSTQNVNIARFARNIECDVFGRFLNTVVLKKKQGYKENPKTS